MAVMELPENYEENTRNKLIKKECPKMLLVIFNFVFLPVVQDLMQKLDSAFASKSGPKAYPRTLLLIVVLYCFNENIDAYEDISKECDKNTYLEIIMMGMTPTRSTFTNFLNKSNQEVIHRVFVSTLILLNEMKVLSIARVFIDGTDIIIRESRHYFIKQIDFKVFDQLNEWGLIHDGSREGIKKNIN